MIQMLLSMTKARRLDLRMKFIILDQGEIEHTEDEETPAKICLRFVEEIVLQTVIMSPMNYINSTISFSFVCLKRTWTIFSELKRSNSQIEIYFSQGILPVFNDQTLLSSFERIFLSKDHCAFSMSSNKNSPDIFLQIIFLINRYQSIVFLAYVVHWTILEYFLIGKWALNQQMSLHCNPIE